MPSFIYVLASGSVPQMIPISSSLTGILMWNQKLLNLSDSHYLSSESAWKLGDLAQRMCQMLLKKILEPPCHVQKVHICPHCSS
jgi:hypothetical protein